MHMGMHLREITLLLTESALAVDESALVAVESLSCANNIA